METSSTTVPQSLLRTPFDRWVRYLKSKDIPVTKQRLRLLSVAYSFEDFFTAEDLINRAKSCRHVSRAAAFRNLPIMVRSGLLKQVDIGTDEAYYSANSKD